MHTIDESFKSKHISYKVFISITYSYVLELEEAPTIEIEILNECTFTKYLTWIRKPTDFFEEKLTIDITISFGNRGPKSI